MTGEYVKVPGSSIGEKIRLARLDPRNQMVHEFAHRIDHEFFGGREFGSELEATPEIRSLMSAYRKTDTGKLLTKAARSSTGSARGLPMRSAKPRVLGRFLPESSSKPRPGN